MLELLTILPVAGAADIAFRRQSAVRKTAQNHYRVTRDFLNRPKVMLHHLLKDEQGELDL